MSQQETAVTFTLEELQTLHESLSFLRVVMSHEADQQWKQITFRIQQKLATHITNFPSEPSNDL